MSNKNTELTHHNNSFGVFTGMVIGGLAGALTMLLIAPQSGKRTRIQIQQKGIELRDRAAGIVDDVVAQARLDGNKIFRDSRRKANELLHQSQGLIADQVEHAADLVKAGKKVIQGTSS